MNTVKPLTAVRFSQTKIKHNMHVCEDLVIPIITPGDHKESIQNFNWITDTNPCLIFFIPILLFFL